MVPSWLGLFGTRTRSLFRKACLLDSNELQASRGILRQFIVLCWLRSLTVRVTDSGPKSRDHSVPSLEAEKTMLVYCRLKVYKMGMQISSWLSVSTKGGWLAHALSGMIFSFYGTGSCVLDCDWLRNFFQKEMGLFRSPDSSFLQNNVYNLNKKVIVLFCSLWKNKHARASFLFFSHSQRLKFVLVNS